MHSPNSKLKLKPTETRLHHQLPYRYPYIDKETSSLVNTQDYTPQSKLFTPWFGLLKIKS